MSSAGANSASSAGAAPGGASNSSAGSTNDPASAGASGSASSGVRRIFYLDVSGNVRAFDEDKPTPRTLVSSAGQGPDGIAVDVAGGHLFWTTMGVPADNDGSLRRSELDGSKVTSIVPTGGSYTPKQLKLDLVGKQLYWSDREGMRIQRAAMDGSALETLVTVATGDAARKDAANWCVGLALDLVHGFIYWTQKGPDDGMIGSIRRAHLQMPDGETDSTRTDVEVLIDGLPEPVDLDLDVSAGYMYWSDRGDDTINRAAIEIPSGKTAATRADRQILVQGVREAIGVTLDLERGHVYYTSGASGRVGRANLDGSGARDLVTGSGALTGIAVVQPNP
ncbi:MAG: 3-hydroxyacyl-CoA dehydrogenase [Pseudomonadota bacterium]